MSIFPFIDPEALAASQDNTLPMFRECMLILQVLLYSLLSSVP